MTLSITFFTFGIVVLFFALSGVIGQGKLMERYFGEKISKVINAFIGIIAMAISFVIYVF